MKRTLCQGLAIVSLALSPAIGGAVPVTLTFDDDTGPAVSYTESGMTITATPASTWLVVTVGGVWDVPCCPFGDDQYDLTAGGLYDLLSIEIVHSDFGDPIIFEGFLGAALVASLTIDGEDPGLIEFVGFTGLDRVRVTATGSFTDPTFDNLTYRSLPEPGTLALIGLGLVGGAMGRRLMRAEP